MDNAIRNDLINKVHLVRKDYLSFGLATFSNGAIVGMSQAYLFIFYIQVLGINPIVASTMFLIAKVFDGFNDPFMGIIVDRTRTRWGKLRPYVMFGSIPFGLIIITLFIPVTWMSMTGKIIYMYITYLTFGIISTLVGVPLGGLAAVSTPNTQERTKILSIGSICSSIGEQSSLVLYSVFIIFTVMRTSLFASAIIIGILAPLFLAFSAYTLKERIQPSGERPTFLDGFKYVVKNKPFLIITISNLVSFFRNLVSATIIFVVTYIFYKPGLMIFFALPGAVASMIGMLITPYLKRRMNAKQIFILATIWHSIGLTIVFLIGPSFGWVVTASAMFFAMLPVGVLNVMPGLMAADTLDYWEYKTGERREGITFSFMGFRSKVSSGFKDFVLGLLIAWAGFKEITDRGLIPGEIDIYFQSPQFEVRLFMIFTIIPAVTNLLSIVPLYWYKLTGDSLKEIQTELALRREAKYNQEESEN